MIFINRYNYEHFIGPEDTQTKVINARDSSDRHRATPFDPHKKIKCWLYRLLWALLAILTVLPVLPFMAVLAVWTVRAELAVLAILAVLAFFGCICCVGLLALLNV